jgi:hypothetical protein
MYQNLNDQCWQWRSITIRIIQVPRKNEFGKQVVPPHHPKPSVSPTFLNPI